MGGPSGDRGFQCRPVFLHPLPHYFPRLECSSVVQGPFWGAAGC